MVAITSQKQRCSQPLWIRTFVMTGMFFAFGCSPSAEERVRGTWVGDVESMVDTPVFTKLTGRPLETATGITRAMVSRISVELGETTCTYSTMGRRDAWPCAVVREEPHEVVVYHVDLPEGRRVLRVQPTETGVELAWWDGRKLALRRP